MTLIRPLILVPLLLACVALLADAPRAAADSVVATVAVGTTPQQIQLTPDGTKLFVSNEVSNSVTVISTATNAILQTIAVGANPGPIRLLPSGAKAYVVNESANTVSVINVGTLTVSATIPVGITPVTLSRTDDGSKVYVANKTSNTVSVISTATDTVIGAPISVGTAPNTMAKTPDGTKLYVANGGSNSVSVISTATNSVVATISALPSQDPGSIHFLPNGTRAYVANRGCVAPATGCPITSVDPTVSVINVATNSVLTAIDVGVPGDAPHAMRITPDGGKLYVVNKHGDEVVVIGTATNTILKDLQLQNGSCSNITFGVGSCPVRIELNADASKAYVVEQRPLATNGVLTAVCTGVVPTVCGGASTDTVLGSVTVGNSPTDLEMTASRAYVSNSGSNTVSVVSISPGVGGIAKLPGIEQSLPAAPGQTSAPGSLVLALAVVIAAASLMVGTSIWLVMRRGIR